MQNEVTISEAFDIAIAAEKASEKLFLGLAAKFVPHPDLAAFWQQYAQDETQHAQWLQALKLKLAPAKLAAHADSDIVASLRSVSAFSVDKALAGVKDLESAFRLVREIENGEINAVFSFLLDALEPDAATRSFVRTQLTHHIGRLDVGIPAAYRDRAKRRAIKAA